MSISAFIIYIVPSVVWDFTNGSHSELVRRYGDEFKSVINQYEADYSKAHPPTADDAGIIPPDHVEAVDAILSYTDQCSIVTVYMRNFGPGAPEYSVIYKLVKQDELWTVSDIRTLTSGIELPSCP